MQRPSGLPASTLPFEDRVQDTLAIALPSTHGGVRPPSSDAVDMGSPRWAQRGHF